MDPLLSFMRHSVGRCTDQGDPLRNKFFNRKPEYDNNYIMPIEKLPEPQGGIGWERCRSEKYPMDEHLEYMRKCDAAEQKYMVKTLSMKVSDLENMVEKCIKFSRVLNQIKELEQKIKNLEEIEEI